MNIKDIINDKTINAALSNLGLSINYEEDNYDAGVADGFVKGVWWAVEKLNNEKLPENETKLSGYDIGYKFIHSDNPDLIMRKMAPQIYDNNKSFCFNVRTFLSFINKNNMYNQLLIELNK